MKTALAMFADFEQDFLGGGSTLCAELAGDTLIGSALRRAALIGEVERRCLVVSPRDEAPARAALQRSGAGERFELLACDDNRRPRRALVRSARKWNLAAWRGSPLGTAWFDEFVEPLAAARVADATGCDSLLCLDGHQPLLDPAIAAAMLRHQADNADDARFVFTQASPGLAGILLHRDALRAVLEADTPVGLLMSYRPETPRADPVARVECARVPSIVAQTPGRWTGDTRASRELIAAAFRDLGEGCDAERLCTWLAAREADGALPSLPLEIEVELTTRDHLAGSRLRPRGDRVTSRELTDAEALLRITGELASYDDRLVVLGGHGDPLLHPRFAEVVRALRGQGICGIAVVTPLVELTDENLAALHEAQVDLVEVQIDANRAATYRHVHGFDGFERVLRNVARLAESRAARATPHPFILCSLTRCAATLEEMEAFFERWVRACGGAVTHGHNDYGGLLPPDELIALRPPVREPCRRLARRLMLLADGRVAQCNQDVLGQASLGDWQRQTLAEVWQGAPLATLREAHRGLSLAAHPLCGRCSEWFRP